MDGPMAPVTASNTWTSLSIQRYEAPWPRLQGDTLIDDQSNERPHGVRFRKSSEDR